MNRTRNILLGLSIVGLLTAVPGEGKDFRGGELKSWDPATGAVKTYQYGRFEVRAKFAQGSGVVSSFFTYNPDPSPWSGWYPTRWNEIDIECLGQYENSIQFATISYDFPVGKTKLMETLFEPRTEYHTYSFDWTPSYVSWRIDGVEVWRETDPNSISKLNIPQGIYMNIWPPDPAKIDSNWAGYLNEDRLPRYAFYDWVKYYAYTPGINGGFTLQWTDNFTTLDATRWRATHYDYYVDGNLADYDQNNVKIKDGHLVLILSQAGQDISTVPGPNDLITPAPERASYVDSVIYENGNVPIPSGNFYLWTAGALTEVPLPNNNFESGQLGAWTPTILPPGGSWSVTPSAKRSGSYGLRLSTDRVLDSSLQTAVAEVDRTVQLSEGDVPVFNVWARQPNAAEWEEGARAYATLSVPGNNYASFTSVSQPLQGWSQIACSPVAGGMLGQNAQVKLILTAEKAGAPKNPISDTFDFDDAVLSTTVSKFKHAYEGDTSPGGARCFQFLPNGVRNTGWAAWYWGVAGNPFNLSAYASGYLKFWLKSTKSIWVRVTTAANNTKDIAVASTGGLWKRIQIPASQFGLKLDSVLYPFGVFVTESVSDSISVNDARWSLYKSDNFILNKTELIVADPNTSAKVNLVNLKSSSLRWSATESTSWITSISPASGTLLTKQQQAITVNISRSGLGTGVYQSTIKVAADGTTVDFPVVLVVGSADSVKARVTTTPNPTYYSTLQAAYNGATSGLKVQCLNRTFTENVTFGSAKSIILEPGCANYYAIIGDGVTTLNGNLAINNGSVELAQGSLNIGL